MAGFLGLVLYGLIGSCDESNKQRQNHVDEERYEAVQVNLAEQPHQSTALLHPRKRHEHVVPVNKGEQALRHHGQGAELDMVRSQDDPATEAVAQINDGHTEAEANHIGERYSERDDQNIVFLEECEVANDSHPHQECGGPQQDATEVIGGHVLRFNADFDETPSNGEDIADDKEDVPAVDELQPVCPAHFTIQSFLEELHKLLLQDDASHYGASTEQQ